jgi:predicted nucleotidyltransferase
MVLAKLSALVLEASKQRGLIEAAASYIKDSVDCFEEALVFGSGSRGEMTAYSDLDILVIVTSKDLCRRARQQLAGLSAAINWPVDLVVTDRQKFEERALIGGLFSIVKDEGICIARQ